MEDGVYLLSCLWLRREDELHKYFLAALPLRRSALPGFVDEEPTTTSDDPQAASSVGLRSSTSASRAGALGEGLPSGVGERSTDNGGQAPSRTGPESEAERGPPPPYPGGAEVSRSRAFVSVSCRQTESDLYRSGEKAVFSLCQLP